MEDGNNFVQLGVVTDGGQECFSKGDSQMLMKKMIFLFYMSGVMGTSTLLKITEEEKVSIENDYDPIDAPPGPYNLRPGVPGGECS